MGIRPSEQSTHGHAFNSKIFFGFSIYGVALVPTIGYTACIANNFMEYAQGVSMISAVTVDFTCFVVEVFKMDMIFANFDEIEKLIETSE